MQKLFLMIGSIAMALAVALGAFGAHTLKNKLSADMLEIFQTGVQYHFYHALGLIFIGLLAYHLPNTGWLRWAGWLMLGGIVIFSGSLYTLALSGISWLGAITPIGGTAFIISWILLVVAILKS